MKGSGDPREGKIYELISQRSYILHLICPHLPLHVSLRGLLMSSAPSSVWWFLEHSWRDNVRTRFFIIYNIYIILSIVLPLVYNRGTLLQKSGFRYKILGMTNQEFITKEKRDELQKELHELESIKRKEVLDALEYAKSLGDLSENAEYHQAREDQARLEDRVSLIKSILQNAVIVKPHTSDVVEVGATVVVKKKGGAESRTFQLVGSEEVDMALGKISHNSPLGEALIGKKKGDTAIFETPGGVIEYSIIEVK